MLHTRCLMFDVGEKCSFCDVNDDLDVKDVDEDEDDGRGWGWRIQEARALIGVGRCIG